MRVIAGDLRARKIKGVPGKQTRPTSDKVKEAVFQMIGPFFQGGTCLDLYAGSGALGIEAISRGMDYGVFIDNQRQAIHIINENIKSMNIEEQTEVLRMDAVKALRVFKKNEASFDLILIDPPYEKADYEKLLNQVITDNLLSENGIIYCEHDPSEVLPQSSSELKIIKQIDYGKTTGISLYQKSISSLN